MQSTTVKQGQSFLDMVMQETGNLSAVVSSALANGISITDDVEIGSTLDLPTGDRMRKDPATAIRMMANQDGTQPIELEGIGYWAIGKTFVVK